MASSDEEGEIVPNCITNYHFVDSNGGVASFSILPLQWGEDDELGALNSEIFLRGTADDGLQPIYKKVLAWRFELSSQIVLCCVFLLFLTGSLAQDAGTIVTSDLFNEMLKNRNDDRCPAKGFYTYDAFIAAANSFPGFGTTGDDTARKKEIAAFFGQTSHETTGGSLSADGPFAGGYCFVREGNQMGSGFYGRGPIQLTGQSNYDLAGQAIGQDLVNNPDLVATDATVSFKTAIWFWMTAQGNKPSCHDVITGQWTPSAADTSANRQPGYGVITNIINGGIECGKGQNPQVEDRIGFYRRYCTILNVAPGDNLDCYDQRNFAEA